MCWYCYWGWPKQVADVYAEAERIVGESAMEYGPAHVVWGDENFDDVNIESCIADCRRLLASGALPDEDGIFYNGPETASVVLKSLVALRALPLKIRRPRASWDSDKDVQDRPPPKGMVMVKASER